MQLKSPCNAPGLALRCVVAAFLTSAALHALEVTEWKNRQPVHVDAPGITSLVLSAETLDAARIDLGDLRLLDPAGREIAFVLNRATRPLVRPVAARSFRSTLTGTSTQLVIESGPFPVEEVALETPTIDFLKRARIETSSDGQVWQNAEEGVPLFRQSGAERLSVRVNARFIRITMDDSRSRPVPFLGARITHVPASTPVTTPLPVRIARREEFAGETVLTLDLSAAHVALDALTVSTPERLFTRRVTVGVRELRDDSAVERTLATGSIYNIATDGDTPVTRRSVPLGFIAPARELMVHVENNDSPPLAISGVELTRFEVMLHFDASTGGEHVLLSGHGSIAAPRYDVSHLRLKNTAQASRIVAGPLAPNPGYRPAETLAGTPLLGAPLDPAPWVYRKAVQLAASGVHQLELDLDVIVHAQSGFADLRLVRDGAQVPYLVERPAVSRSLELPLTVADDPKRPRFSRWEIKLPRTSLPLTRLTLTSTSPLFQRHLRVFEKLTDDRGNTQDRTLATSEWSRTPGDQRPLALSFTSPPATNMLFIETDNGDNPPLALGSAAGAHAVTRLLFKADAAPMSLYYGNRQAVTPRYDLALVARQILAAEKTVATLGVEEQIKADGWTKTILGGGRGGFLFWGALALVVIVLLIVVAKLLPKPPEPSA